VLKKESAIAIEQEKKTAVDEAACKKQQEDVLKIQNECKQILEQAMPQFNAAIKSLDTLKAADISELKMYQKPHPDIKLVFDAVCLLQGVKQEWPIAQ
jgi:dynein heavy chain